MTDSKPPPDSGELDGPAVTGHVVANALAPGDRFLEVEGIHPPGSSQDLRLKFTRRVIFLARRWRNLINDGLREVGQSHARWITLTWISILDGAGNHGQLADRIGVELPTLIRLLNRLEAEGLVERAPLNGHGRAKTVKITPAGAKVLAELNRITREVRSGFLQGVEDDEIAQCVTVFDTLLTEPEA